MVTRYKATIASQSDTDFQTFIEDDEDFAPSFDVHIDNMEDIVSNYDKKMSVRKE